MSTPQAAPVAATEPRSRAGRAERGQTLVVVAVMIVVLIAFLGLVIDGGNVYAQRRQLQNAADAAALAGARAQLLKGTAAVASAASQYATANGADGCEVVTTTNTVTANVSKTVETFFVRVVGINSMPVGASATAAISTPTSLTCSFLPLTVPYKEPSQWPTGQFTIWQRCDSSKNDVCSNTVDIQESMNGWLNLDGKSADPNSGAVDSRHLVCWICPDRSTCSDIQNPGVDLGWVNGTPGLDSNALQAVDSCAEGKTVYIPLYGSVCCDQNNAAKWGSAVCPSTMPNLGNGQCNYDIVGFAPFHITSVKDTGDTRAITGYMDWDYVGDNCVVSSGDGGRPAGLYVIKLIR